MSTTCPEAVACSGSLTWIKCPYTFIAESLNTWTTSFLPVTVEINTSFFFSKISGLAKQWKGKLFLEQLQFWQEIKRKTVIAVNGS
jgi:hypothetical protein